MDLTPRQKQVKELRESTDPPMTFREVGVRLNLSRHTTRRHYHEAMDKIACPNPVGQYDMPDRRPEYADPDKAAELIDTATNPLLESVAKAARECNLPEGTARALMKRLERDYLPVAQEVERIKTDVLVREFESLGLKLLKSVDAAAIEKMQPYQRVVGAAICVDKRELLDGRPTERISVEDRQMLPEITRLLLKEAERRGLLTETNPLTGEVSIAVDQDAPAMVRAGRERVTTVDVETI